MAAIKSPGQGANPGTGSDIIIPNASPVYQSIVIGNDTPINEVLDSDPTRPVSQLVLETYSIPFSQPVLGGTLPGYDIRNQDATGMLRLALSTELLDTPPEGSGRTGTGGFAEVEIDADGIARFYIVGVNVASNLDVRYCIPTGQVVNSASLVIVRGYDPPITRELREPFDGLKNKEFMAYDDCAIDTCEQDHNAKYATISYDDPSLDQAYNDDIINSYEIGAFESMLGYVIDFDVSSDSESVPGLRISFGDSTKEYIRFDSELFKVSKVDGTISLPTFRGAQDASTSLGAGRAAGQPPGGVFGAGVPATISTVNEQTGECTVSNTTLIGSRITINADRFKRLNKFGQNESDFLGITDIVFSGQKVFQITEFGGAVGGFTGWAKTVLNPHKELISLQHGRNWTWSNDEDENIEIDLFSIIDSEYTSVICRFYDPTAAPIPGFEYRESTKDLPNTYTISENQFRDYICAIGDPLGYKVSSGEMCIVVERRRPSIDIYDPRGFAMGVATSISVTYTPIVLVDLPPPVAYAATAPLQSIDESTGSGGTTLPVAGIIDQTDGIRDNDPSTVQDFDESQMSILQDNTNGSTIDITLPFLNEDECLDLAQNFLAQQNEIVTSTSIVLGPDSTPQLGDVFTDTSGNTSIINEINYSYTDASQYLINVTTGPKYLTAGSFNSSQYQLQTEEVTKEGIIVQDRGDGATYVVRIQGGDELVALSFVLEDISVGDKCQVRIFNNPVEKI
jgi:hypothetical protein